ncbi:hypothetical protein [Stutzerimonas stutzeri]|uniref:hypothetical protein n=1 Tax=Stutzerimonas stutzeri TaxID=316 RepID=UPI00265CE29D|nr:hypothetical protein [Stutzerimonas stutzeri]MCF6783748.1 hypothetical protein [Stutzerimonas stutzeri]
MNSDHNLQQPMTLCQQALGLADGAPSDVPAATERLSRILEVLIAQGREYHLDDDPGSIGIFSEAEAEFLAEELANIRQVLGSERLWDVAAPYYGLSNDEDEADQKQTQAVGRGPRMG